MCDSRVADRKRKIFPSIEQSQWPRKVVLAIAMRDYGVDGAGAEGAMVDERHGDSSR